ncbi:MAG: hypothetical protein A2941_01175 [Candidatus Yanofskybacteria bacterium RIFCSPLOWO2_01_FULL_49_17]|uniref:Glycosyltransferase 2-like domain-containing protein n=1 Tax=Candidatus Yanofskybacteria bacterium RIFCSPLOWO2_01_FULL_49_17 TaxID=1802700 RepID=A0A1F8GQ97_9BACT|nr:MAG: hypothetical protein A2941_01175 [Candidatus Yanofskybacteria bacterium RIFCSPLOWO2_01_FULL_49_17]
MLSIIIVNYKQPELLRLCLKTLKRTLRPDFDHEIIVADSEASVESGNVATEEFAGIRYIPFKENVGYTRLVNEGVMAAKGDAFFIMNSDITPLPDSIENMYGHLKHHPEIGLIGPQLLNLDGSIQQSCFRYYSPLDIVYRRTPLGILPFGRKAIERFKMQDKDLTRPCPADWLSGSALMGSMAAAKKVGPMDKKLFLYMSDVDWPRRFWENGYQVVYYPTARMYHYHHRHSRGRFGMLDSLFNVQTRQHIFDYLKYLKKYGFR